MSGDISRRTLLGSMLAGGLGLLGGVRGASQQPDTEPTAEQWPQYGRDSGNTGANLEATGPDPEGGEVGPLWTVTPEAPISAQPAVTESNVVVSTDSAVLGINKQTGERDWQYEGGEFLGSPTVVATDFISDEVYIGTTGGTIVGISTATGDQLWQYDTQNERLARTIPLSARGEVLYVAGSAGLSAVSAPEQRQLWADSVNAGTAPAAGANSVWSGNRLGMSGRSRAWNEDVLDSQPVTQSPVGDQYVTRDTRGRWVDQATPTVADETVYLPSRGLASIDATTGRRKWILDVDLAVAASPAVDSEQVYFGSGTDIAELSADQKANAGTVYAMPVDSIEDERRQLQQELDSVRSEIAELRAAARAGENVDRDEATQLRDDLESLEQQRQELLELDSSTLAWSVDVDGPVNTAPAVTSETVYVTTDAGTVYALSTADGSEQWRYSLVDADTQTTVTGPVVAGDRVYVASEETGLVALGVGNEGETSNGDTSDGESESNEGEQSDDASADSGESNEDGEDEATTAETSDESSGESSESESSDGSGPGFGVPAGLAALGGVSYLLGSRDFGDDVQKREQEDEGDEQE